VFEPTRPSEALKGDMPYNIVWFKKDLRTKDHAPFFNALKEGSSLGLFIIEPEWLHSPEFDSGHYVFLQESLRDLQSDLRKIGVPQNLQP